MCLASACLGLLCFTGADASGLDDAAYKDKAKAFLAGQLLQRGVPSEQIDVRSVLKTDSDEWKLVVVYFKQGATKHPSPLLISKDGGTIVLSPAIFVDGKPVLSAVPNFAPETEKVKADFATTGRIVFNQKGKKTAYVFSDPDCKFCAQLESKIATHSGDYRFVMKAFPLEKIHPDAKKKLVKAQEKWLLKNGKGKKDAGAEAVRFVNEDIADGIRAGVSGTPTVILEDGTVVANPMSLFGHP